jgi:hypothetical protein
VACKKGETYTRKEELSVAVTEVRVFGRICFASAIVASVRGLYPRCPGHLLSVERQTRPNCLTRKHKTRGFAPSFEQVTVAVTVEGCAPFSTQ